MRSIAAGLLPSAMPSAVDQPVAAAISFALFGELESFERLLMFAGELTFRVQITGRRSRSMLLQSCSDLLLSHTLGSYFDSS